MKGNIQKKHNWALARIPPMSVANIQANYSCFKEVPSLFNLPLRHSFRQPQQIM